MPASAPIARGRVLRAIGAVALLAVTAGATLAGSASTLGGLSPRGLGAGTAAVAACDTNGFTVAYTLASGSVTATTIGGIADPGCEGGQLRVTVANASASIGSGGPVTVPVDADTVDTSVTVALTPQPAAAQVTRIHASIVGP